MIYLIIYLIIYLVGYLLAFVYMIYDARKEKDIYMDDIEAFLLLSLISWFAFPSLIFSKQNGKGIVIFKKRKEK